MLWGVNSQWLPERQWGSAGFRVGSSQPANPAFWACFSGLPLVTTKYSSQNTGKPFFLWGWWPKHCAGARPVLFCRSWPRFLSLHLCRLNYDMAIADVPFLVGDAALSFGKCQSWIPNFAQRQRVCRQPLSFCTGACWRLVFMSCIRLSRRIRQVYCLVEECHYLEERGISVVAARLFPS